MAKTRISSTDLIWIFRQRLASFDDGLPSIPIAIVPSEAGWTVVLTPRHRARQPGWVRRIEQIQKQLRDVYVLTRD